MNRIWIMLICIFCCSLAFADTVYIHHAPSVIMRDAPNSDANVVVELNNGTAVELMKSDSSTNYSFVRTDKGKQGWIRNAYIQKTPADNPLNFFARVKNWFHKRKVQEPMTNSTTQVDLQQIQTELQNIRKQQYHNMFWFFLGVSVTLLGIAAGYFLGIKRRRSHWY